MVIGHSRSSTPAASARPQEDMDVHEHLREDTRGRSGATIQLCGHVCVCAENYGGKREGVRLDGNRGKRVKNEIKADERRKADEQQEIRCQSE